MDVRDAACSLFGDDVLSVSLFSKEFGTGSAKLCHFSNDLLGIEFVATISAQERCFHDAFTSSPYFKALQHRISSEVNHCKQVLSIQPTSTRSISSGLNLTVG